MIVKNQDKECKRVNDDEKETLRKYYLDNEMSELKKIANPIIKQRNFPMMEHDDLYSDAMKVVEESLASYDENRNCSFKTFLVGNIKRSFYDYRKKGNQWKRRNLETENGILKKDENGYTIPIQNVSLDAETEDGISLAEKIPYIENNTDEEELSPQMEEYLNGLSKVQRKILIHLADGYKKEEIIDMLNIDDFLYKDSIMAIKDEKNKRKIRMLIRR